MKPEEIDINDFTYKLPGEKIAAYPLPERDQSKLLIFNDGKIQEDIYKNIALHIPANSMLVFNDTRVIPARILFMKSSGGVIEVFCLEPYLPQEYNLAMNTKGKVLWKCMIGGAGKWKTGILEKTIFINDIPVTLQARIHEKIRDGFIVEFNTGADHSFAEIIEHAGDVPLPPYIKRKADDNDIERYQTVFARYNGSVAAPTAALHFTPHIFSSLQKNKINTTFVTLHVGAGTFKPVKAALLKDHEMHSEWIDVALEVIEHILLNADKTIIAVGTTSLRTMETLYWMGVKALLDPGLNENEIALRQWEVYKKSLVAQTITVSKALENLLAWMKKNNLERLVTKTQILIVPGYTFKICHALVTNFHQPGSTLLLLIAAITSEWMKMYDYALENDFRFLSYGDGCLLFMTETNNVD
ncbi:MAG: S-adenosylmethionine:tRNA ribosyltransferase-isomerase [Chitinophagaceae bacterium]|nr:S-adenosylmethionine:tRNA ribosyltransferase-isomerase [Chitinophagaceae bacterium]